LGAFGIERTGAITLAAAAVAALSGCGKGGKLGINWRWRGGLVVLEEIDQPLRGLWHLGIDGDERVVTNAVRAAQTTYPPSPRTSMPGAILLVELRISVPLSG